ncbi:MAG: hypothetical protein ACREI3_04735 [Nitrospirales bacterium]
MLPSQLRRGWIIGLLMVGLLIAIGLITGRSLLTAERQAYDRGARVTAQYLQCRERLPPQAFLEQAFAWGDPNSCEDVDAIEEGMARAAGPR